MPLIISHTIVAAAAKIAPLQCRRDVVCSKQNVGRQNVFGDVPVLPFVIGYASTERTVELALASLLAVRIVLPPLL